MDNANRCESVFVTGNDLDYRCEEPKGHQGAHFGGAFRWESRQCPFGAMDWHCSLQEGHKGPHESQENFL